MTDDITKILKENETRIQEIQPAQKLKVRPPPPKPVKPEPILEPEIIHVEYKSKLLEAKKEYLTDRDIGPVVLAKKHGIDPLKLQEIIKDENWDKQRLQLYVRADEKAREIMTSTLAEVKGRHILISRMLQRVGKQSMRQIKPGQLSPKEALTYLTEGVRIERETHGMDKQSPKIVTIIAAQQKIINKYKK